MVSRYIVQYTDFVPEDASPSTIAYWKEFEGKYVSEGGGATHDITKAKVIGWANHSRWASERYRLIPIRIEVIHDA